MEWFGFWMFLSIVVIVTAVNRYFDAKREQTKDSE